MSCTPFVEHRVADRQELVDVAVREWMIRGITAAQWFHQCLSSPTSDRRQDSPWIPG
jgi:hypothetical protein